MEGMWLRFNPIIHMSREVLAKGQVGDILSVQMHVGYAEQAINTEVRDGIARDALSVFGCYGFSIAHFLFNNPLTVHCSGRVDAHGSIQHANVVLTYPSFEFQISASIVATLSNTLEVVGSRGSWRISHPVLDPCYGRWKSYNNDEATSKMISKLKSVFHTIQDELSFIHPLRGSGFRNEIEQINISILNKQVSNTTNPLEATLACHHIQAAARKSLNVGSPQTLKHKF
jgi:predicted dehydrogenase